MKRHADCSPSRRALLTAAAAAAPYFAWTQPVFANLSRNDRPRVGCVGFGGHGFGDAIAHAQFGDIVAVCDVDSRRSMKAKYHDDVGRGRADAYEDYRRILDRDDVDVVSVSTPDHWHVKIAVEALMAGKHVFCQKPLTLTIEENQLIREACKRYGGRVFGVGTQQRSSRDLFLRAVNMVQKGLLGRVAKVTCSVGGGLTGGPFPVVVPHASLDWYMWLGPAPLVEYRTERCHHNFRWWYEYSGGKFTDWGAHHVDIALWALGLDRPGTGPVEVDGTDANHPVAFEGGYPTVANRFNTSHDFDVVHHFEGGLRLHVTSRGDNGILFEGDKGRLFVNRGKITGRPIEEAWDRDAYVEEDVKRLYKRKPYEGHKANFFRCIREGGLPVSDAFSHVQTMNVCHLSSIAARLRRTIRWDPIGERILGDEQAAAMLKRKPRAGYEIPPA